MQDLRYPIGPYEPGPPPDAAQRLGLIGQLAAAPAGLRQAVSGLSPEQLDTTYRPGGWSVRQVVHHLADAHMNWYVRTKLALTEDEPLVKPYEEALWAETAEARSGPIEPSLSLLDGLCQRWAALFGSLTNEQWKRGMVHPERGVFALDGTLPMMVWHGRHHTAQIASLPGRMNWR
jgi:uncharacterized damage-inducible protein DinB